MFPSSGKWAVKFLGQYVAQPTGIPHGTLITKQDARQDVTPAFVVKCRENKVD